MRVGPGTTNAATPLQLVEYTTAGVATGYVVSLPSAATPKITASASATSEGLISLSGERDNIIIPGYDAVSGTAAVASTAVASYNRELFSVSAAGVYTKLGVTTTLFDANNIRSGTICGANYYGSGANSGIILTDNSNTVVSNTSTNNRQLNVHNGQLYFSTGSGTRGIYQVGNNLPNTTGQLSSNIINTGASSNYGFAISPDGLTCYIADDGGLGITKYTRPNVASSFTLAYTLNGQGARGLTADFTTSPYTVYATTSATSPNSIIKVVDNGANSLFTLLATAPATYVFRGIVFAPHTSPCLVLSPNVTNVSCNGAGNGSINLATSSTNGYTANAFSWTGPAAFTSTNQNISGLAPGTYTVVATSLNGKTGCTAMATATVTQPSAMTITNVQTDVSCNGGNDGNATVSVTGGTAPYAYQWSPSGGTGATASGLTAGSYTCTITDNNGCMANSTVTITEPTVLTAGNSQTNVTCFGGNNGTATVSPSGGTPPYTYSWAPSGGNNATASGLSMGNYTCTITDNNGCTILKTFTISQPTVINLTASQTNVSCNGGNNGAANVSPSGGTPGYTYSWAPTGGNNPTASSLSAGTYTCTVEDANNCIVSQVFTITEPPALTATVSQSNIDCNGGNNGSATVNVSGGTPGYSYSWSPYGGNNATAMGLTAGPYTCTITDSKNCVLSMQVIIGQPAAMTGSISGDTTICNGNSTVITFNATPNTTIIYTENASQQNIVVGASGIANLAVSPGTTTTYSLQSIQDNTTFCVQALSGSVTVNVNAVPNAPLTSDIAYCQFDNSVALNATGQNILWYTTATGGTGNASAPVPPTNAAGTFTWYASQSTLGCESQRSPLNVLVKPQPVTPVVTSAAQYCQFGPAGQLTAIGDSISWYTSAVGGTGDPAGPVIITNTSSTTTYYVTQTQDGCESPRLPVPVTVNPKPAPPVTQDIIYCQNDNAIPLTAEGQNLTWYTAASGGTGIHTAPVPSTLIPGITVWYVSQAVDGCESDRAVMQLIIKERPIASITASSNEVCQGATLSFTYTGTTVAGAIFNWILPIGATIVSGTGQGPVIIKFTQPGSNTIILEVSAANGGCTSTASYTVDVIGIPEAQIGIPPSACAGDTVSITIPVASPGIANYQWDFSGGDVLRTPTNTDGTYRLRWISPGLHTVSLTVVSQQQCPSFTTTADIDIHPLPDATIADMPAEICANDTVLFSARTHSGNYYYMWGPGQFFTIDGDSSIVKALLQFSRDVVLTVYDNYGCTASNSRHIELKPCCEIYFPTAFSPNGDDRNDVFRPITNKHHNIRIFKILDRWGNSVFSTANEIPSWDGNYKGVPQEPGTYYYYIRFECTDGKPVEQTGDVILLR
ncbi:MAG: hypothetical protein BGO69_00055 [Bacteroidetes bacterium 46-16]|nr:MAG: hypothetical protein BGO69_00055 [Bacteroidetes bacterium 46-16]